MARTAKLIAMLCLMLFLTLSVSAQAQSPALSVAINGVPQTLEPAPFVKDGQTLAPLRSLADALNASVSWDDQSKSIVITKQNTVIHLRPNNKEVQINDESQILPVAPEIIEERTFVPLRFLAEALGFKVQWDADKQEINLMPIDYLAGKVAYDLTWVNNQVNLTVENISNEPVVFNFNTGQEADFVLSRKDQVIWRWSDGRMFTQNTWQLDLKPGQKDVISISLNQPTDDGSYKLEAFFLGQPNPKAPVCTLVSSGTKTTLIPKSK